MIRATNWHEVAVMPAKAGIQGREGMDTGFRRYDKSRKKPWGGGMATISYSVDDRKIMNHFVVETSLQ